MSVETTRIQKILIGLAVIVTLYLIACLIWPKLWVGYRGDKTDYKKENKILQDQLVKLQEKASADSVKAVYFEGQYEQEKIAREETRADINRILSSINGIKKEYEKISNSYVGISNDSLRRAFSAAFRPK